jgi:hypothetical protein
MLHTNDPRELVRWHYVPKKPLAAAQLIASGSVDAETVAIIWLLLEHGASLTVAGPTNPQAGAGKTTTLNALLQFLPERTTVHYMEGMKEDFSFLHLPGARPDSTCVFSNEISNHLAIYMWGDIARRYLQLPGQGYQIVTTAHADTVEEVIRTYRHSVGIGAQEARRLGLIVNIGFTGRRFVSERRWMNVHFIYPFTDANNPLAIIPIPLARWNRSSDSFEHTDLSTRTRLAEWYGLSAHEFNAALARRIVCLRDLSSGGNATPSSMASAILQLRQREQKL